MSNTVEMIYLYLEHLMKHNYAILDEGTIINHEMWSELLKNKEARQIIDKYVKH
ncbi:hypothetical protein [Clostridium botulinum]|uniref:hypothetical protein n=1 Tax=Clostridium botulinum TaxID=1491 RepID=UPI001C9ABB2E|nr:hypothetical protein [Clostridium botulinum]MBY6838774.1 hypothetical protein [Clostridium botulinum]